MRYVIQKAGGGFVGIHVKGGLADQGRYAYNCPDAQDAHDFGSEEAAEKWMRSQMNLGGAVRILNDDGSWPLEE